MSLLKKIIINHRLIRLRYIQSAYLWVVTKKNSKHLVGNRTANQEYYLRIFNPSNHVNWYKYYVIILFERNIKHQKTKRSFYLEIMATLSSFSYFSFSF